MSNLIDEVRDDLKRERYENLFHKHGKALIAITAIIVLSVALGTWYKESTIHNQEKTGELYRLAIASTKSEQLPKLEEVIEDGTGGFVDMAKFMKAKIIYQDGAEDEAIELFDAISNDASANQATRHLAAFQATSILANKGQQTADIDKRFEALLTPENPWLFSAKEAKAIYHLTSGQSDEGIALLKEISESAGAPGNMRKRAKKILVNIIRASRGAAK